MALKILLVLHLAAFCLFKSSSGTDYIDHISCAPSANAVLYPGDQIYSLDGNTRLTMSLANSSQPGEWQLQQRPDSSGTFSQIWTTNSQAGSTNAATINHIHPLFAVQADRNIVVYQSGSCVGICRGWTSNTAQSGTCCYIYHFFVHNNGYAYLLDDNYNVQFTTDPTIKPTASPTLYPTGSLLWTPNPTPQPVTVSPSTSPITTTSSPTTDPTCAEEPMDLNTANITELDKLPYIDLIKAQQIIDYRPICSPLELTIDPKKISQITIGRLNTNWDWYVNQSCNVTCCLADATCDGSITSSPSAQPTTASPTIQPSTSTPTCFIVRDAVSVSIGDNRQNVSISYDNAVNFTQIGYEDRWLRQLTLNLTNITQSTILRYYVDDIGHTGGFLGIIVYDGIRYGITIPLNNSNWEIISSTDGNIYNLVYTRDGDGLQRYKYSNDIDPDDIWIWNGGADNDILFEFRFENIINHCNPTFSPTMEPSIEPTIPPITSYSPTRFPTEEPTYEPTENPSDYPSSIPTMEPTLSVSTLTPSNDPTLEPTTNPSYFPTNNPIQTVKQTGNPSASPTSALPSLSPTKAESVETSVDITSTTNTEQQYGIDLKITFEYELRNGSNVTEELIMLSLENSIKRLIRDIIGDQDDCIGNITYEVTVNSGQATVGGKIFVCDEDTQNQLVADFEDYDLTTEFIQKVNDENRDIQIDEGTIFANIDSLGDTDTSNSTNNGENLMDDILFLALTASAILGICAVCLCCIIIWQYRKLNKKEKNDLKKQTSTSHHVNLPSNSYMNKLHKIGPGFSLGSSVNAVSSRALDDEKAPINTDANDLKLPKVNNNSTTPGPPPRRKDKNTEQIELQNLSSNEITDAFATSEEQHSLIPSQPLPPMPVVNDANVYANTAGQDSIRGMNARDTDKKVTPGPPPRRNNQQSNILPQISDDANDENPFGITAGQHPINVEQMDSLDVMQLQYAQDEINLKEDLYETKQQQQNDYVPQPVPPPVPPPPKDDNESEDSLDKMQHQFLSDEINDQEDNEDLMSGSVTTKGGTSYMSITKNGYDEEENDVFAPPPPAPPAPLDEIGIVDKLQQMEDRWTSTAM